MYVLLLFAIHKEPEIEYILLGLFFAFSFFSPHHYSLYNAENNL